MSSFKRKVKTTETPAASATLQAADAPSTPIATGSADTSRLPSVTSSMVTIAPISGVKPWIHTGLGMVSSGHRELDDMLHGGFPAGSIVTYYLDNYSNYTETLMGYSIAEGMSHGQRCLICSFDENALDRIFETLPFNLSYDKIHNNRHLSTSAGSSASEDASRASSSAETAEHGLKIAWQYEKYLAKNNPQMTNKLVDTRGLSYCCSYDLSKRLQPDILDNGSLLIQRINALDEVFTQGPVAQVSAALTRLLRTIIHFLTQEYQQNSRAVSRIFLPHFHTLFVPFLCTHQITAVEVYTCLSQFLGTLRQVVTDARTIVHVALPSPAQNYLPEPIYPLLHVFTDTIFDIETFAGHAETIPNEFKDFVAFFRIRHLRQRGVLATPPPKATKYGVKRDRRKLHLELLHLPPEESRAMNSSNSINCSSSTTSQSSQNSAAIAGNNSMKTANMMGLTLQQVQQQAQQQTHAHDHSHSHNHSHNHASNSTNHIRLEVESDNTSSNNTSYNTSSVSTSTNNNNSSLKAALASARAARIAAAAAAAAGTTPMATADGAVETTAIRTITGTTSNTSTNSADSSDSADDSGGGASASATVQPIAIHSANVRTIKINSFQKKNNAPPSMDF